jgi:DNA uptake protein ComE-like DNA-binding protein
MNICRWPILNGIALGAGFLFIVVLPVGAASHGDWITLEDCRLVPNEGNDGDSFHVRAKDREYIFRLYFVDAPEIEAATPSRLIDQAKYFGITVPQTIEVGEAAKSFVEEKLREPFIVITRMASAMGRSRKERFYGFVETKEGDLGELLVENGLARPYGTTAPPPGVSSSRAESEKMEKLENESKQQKIGAWGENSGRLNVRFDHANQPAGSTAISNFSEIERPTVRAIQSSRSAPGPGGQAKTKFDVNSATEEQLETIPGVGPTLAERIIAARPFKSADDLRSVKGIGDAKYAKIRPYFD